MPRARKRLRFLITAGPTREYLDSVRYFSNDSSGRMGFALAAAAAARGHDVTLIHGPVALPAPRGVRVLAVVSAEQMWRACRAVWPRCDVLLMAAAVADYAPARRSRHKLRKSGAPLTIELRPTVDILASLSRARRAGQCVIGFALEDRRGRTHARRKLEQKYLDAIILNSPSAVGAAESRLELLATGSGWVALGRAGKSESARHLVRIAEQLFMGQTVMRRRRRPDVRGGRGF
jgi:phosphopantothenoylcysteine decarboxylase/phosphopantothenate--cysteine ligase